MIIVGGSLVGLSAAAFLAWHGTTPLLVERHAGTAIHPRAGGFNPRTMELFRTLAIEDAVRAAQDLSFENSGILRVESLAGKELGWFDAPYLQLRDPDRDRVSPCGWGRLMQNRLEPILRARAESLGAQLRFSTELVSVEQDADEVRAVIRDRKRQTERTVHAQYLIAADGSKSTVRQQLGIAAEGPGALSHMLSILFQADLGPALRGRRFALCHIENGAIHGGVLILQDDRTLLAVPYDPSRGEAPSDFTPTRCIEIVRAAIGVPDLEVTLHSVLPWELAAQVATQLQAGRIFLAGDAAHVLPPTGAFGANAGIQDVHNLAWKLAYVLKQRAGRALLDTYAKEREKVAHFTVQQAVARSVQRFGRLQASDVKVSPIVDDLLVMMGYRYQSTAIHADAAAPPYEDPRSPSGQPGGRAAHVMLRRTSDEARLSTIDLFRQSFTLLAGRTADPAKFRAIADRLNLPIQIYTVGGDELQDADGRFQEAYGIGEAGVVLVRPDGFIAWRVSDLAQCAETTIAHALHAILAIS